MNFDVETKSRSISKCFDFLVSGGDRLVDWWSDGKLLFDLGKKTQQEMWIQCMYVCFSIDWMKDAQMIWMEVQMIQCVFRDF